MDFQLLWIDIEWKLYKKNGKISHKARYYEIEVGNEFYCDDTIIQVYIPVKVYVRGDNPNEVLTPNKSANIPKVNPSSIPLKLPYCTLIYKRKMRMKSGRIPFNDKKSESSIWIPKTISPII